MKAKPAGLYYTHGPVANQSGIDHAVINVGWKDIQPTKGSFNWGPIDSVMAKWPTWTFRLRLQSGLTAPAWVLTASGGGVTVMGPKSGIVAKVPRWWTPGYLAEWDALMAAVATRYNSNPRLLDVVNAGPMTINAEPFIRSGQDATSNKNLVAAGYSLANDTAAHRATLASIMNHFSQTRASLALHTGWQIPQADGKALVSWPILRDFVNQLRAQYGDRLLFQDNGLSPVDTGNPNANPTTAANLWDWFAAVAKAGTIVGFQTKGDNSMPPGKTIIDAVKAGYKLGAYFVEHNQFGTDASVARTLDQQLKARGA